MKKICVVTGSRAEYELLKPLILLLQQDSGFQLQLVVTCSHLSPHYGLTVNEIKKDDFPLTDQIEMLLSSNTNCSVAKSIGMGVISFADSLRRLKPDFLLVLGDRFEILSAVIPAFIMKIPVVHLHGGEMTIGAIDDGLRHSISKMSYLHFTSTQEYRQRVIQLGENPERVFNVGAIGVENVKKLNFLTKSQLEKEIDFKFREKNILVTFHPPTLEDNDPEEQVSNLCKVLNDQKDLGIIFTYANADAGGMRINQMIDIFVSQNPKRSRAFMSMGGKKYLSTLKYVDAIVGNSSSGIIEAPSIVTPTINIGDRQSGRIKAKSIIDCQSTLTDLRQSFVKVFSDRFKNTLKTIKNPYDGGNTSKKIFDILKNLSLKKAELKKDFYDIPFSIE